MVVEDHPFPDPGLCPRTGLPGVQVDALIFQGPPEPPDKDIVEEDCKASLMSESDFRRVAQTDLAPGTRTRGLFDLAAILVIMSILACAGVRYPILEWRRCRL